MLEVELLIMGVVLIGNDFPFLWSNDRELKFAFKIRLIHAWEAMIDMPRCVYVFTIYCRNRIRTDYKDIIFHRNQCSYAILVRLKYRH